VKSINVLVDEVLEDIRDVSSARFSKWDVVRGLKEGIESVATVITKVRENLLLNLITSGVPLVVSIPAAGADGASRILLPETVDKIVLVEIKIGSSWIPIDELRSGEWMAGVRRSSTSGSVLQEMTYEIAYPYLVIRPGVTAQKDNVLAISYEAAIPPLMMGKVKSPGAAQFALPAGYDKVEGTIEASLQNDAYNALRVGIFSGPGTGESQVVTDYVASTRMLTFGANWATPLVEDTSKFAFFTPFYGALAHADNMVQVRACIKLLSSKRNEDVSGFIARYNSMEEEFISKIHPVTPGPKQMIPVDLYEGAY